MPPTPPPIAFIAEDAAEQFEDVMHHIHLAWEYYTQAANEGLYQGRYEEPAWPPEPQPRVAKTSGTATAA